MSKHPLQPLEINEDGILRFKKNAIVRFLLDAGPFDMNSIACIPFSQEDREQFVQLIGYSLDGFGELSYIRDEIYKQAERDSQRRKMNKPQRTCKIKITHENSDKGSFYFFAPQEIAEQMKDFGYLRLPIDECYQQYQLEIDPRFKYEEIKAYLLSLGEENHADEDTGL